MASAVLPTNPYIAGRAVGQARGFCGREDILRLIETRLRTPEQSAVVLYGQRRIGKTSILLQLQRRLPAPPFVPVYFDLMDRARQHLGQVLADIAAALAEAAAMPPPDAARFDDRGRYFRKEFLPALYAALGPGRNPVLLLDEFDVLDMAVSDQATETAAARTFFPYLRQLLEGEPRLKFVFVVGRRVEDLSIIVKSLFKTTTSQRVSVLEGDTARGLVRTAHRQGTLGMAQPVVERILALTAGHPYLTQLVCQILWDTAYAANPKSPPTIQHVEQVEAAAERALEAGQNIFEWIWDGLPPAERVIFAAIAGATDERTVIGEEQLTQLLQSQGVRILTRDLELAPRTLVEWEMLRQADGGYRFFIELMRRWVAERKPLPRVRDELDRIVPLADNLYRSADAFYRQGDTENALSQLRQALRVNENHLKARLLLGQVLLERKEPVEAVKELEEAYKYDDAAARYPLLRALLVLAEAHERTGADDAALACYERVLTLSPQDRVAGERRNALLARHADAARASGRLADAQRIYERAGDNQQAGVVAAERVAQERERMLDEARGYETRAEWDKALAIYQQLMDKNPADPQWHEAVARVKGEREQLLHYTAGAQALGKGNSPEAVAALSEVVRSNPSYRDAAQLLTKAQEQLTTELRRRESRDDWKGAIALCDEILTHQPNDEHWLRERDHLAEEERLGERYAVGLSAIGKREWPIAVTALEEVLAVRPSYKDAARQLQRAQRGQSGPNAGRRWLVVNILSCVLAVLFAALVAPSIQQATSIYGWAITYAGLLFGASIAGAQWFELRAKLDTAAWWIPAGGIGSAVGGLIVIAYGTASGIELACVLASILAGSMLQCLVLWRGRVRALPWLVGNPLAWLLAAVAFSVSGITISFIVDSFNVGSTSIFGLGILGTLLSFIVSIVCLGGIQSLWLRPTVAPLRWISTTAVGFMVGAGIAIAPIIAFYSTPNSQVIIIIVVAAFVWALLALLALLAAPLLRRLAL